MSVMAMLRQRPEPSGLKIVTQGISFRQVGCGSREEELI
jgi:hypothetical protein